MASHIWYSEENSNLNFKSLQVFNRYVDRILQQMYSVGKVSRLNFRTEKGKIYGLFIEDCWDYIFRNNLPEKLIKAFMRLLGSEGFVTNVELKELGFSSYVIEKWIERKLCKEGNYIQMYNVSGDFQIKVYFLPRYFGQLELYLNSPQFKEIYNKYCVQRNFGNYLGHFIEDIVAELFTKKGYEVKKRVRVIDVIQDKGTEKEKIIAEVDVFCFNPKDGEILLIECKTTNHTIGIGHLHKLIYLRNIRYKGSGKIILIDPFDNIGSSIWSSLPLYPYLRIWKLKDLVRECEQYQPETYMKLKKEFGDLRAAIKTMTKTYYVDGKLMGWKEMEENKKEWYKGADKLS
ncbi:MAG: hypothetical protein QW156_03285 [Candidatus Aenigmatarchaeota archaeon]